ncbi:MAG: PEP-CTERM sorting domain-containing protein [Alphaproteobacteria bacterium]|nr:PEP-CTERM sorting domain-containing protein [Alphaproteobacteria bacterium]
MITEAAATLCDHKVTFDVDRADAGGSFVWIDGSPTLLNHDDSILSLATCKIVELSNNSYEVDWSTGEILDVTDNGTHLDLSSSLSWFDKLGPMEGLFTSDNNPGAWRVTEGSLFDPVPEPTTLSLIAIGMGLTAIAMIRRRVPKGVSQHRTGIPRRFRIADGGAGLRKRAWPRGPTRTQPLALWTPRKLPPCDDSDGCGASGCAAIEMHTRLVAD